MKASNSSLTPDRYLQGNLRGLVLLQNFQLGLIFYFRACNFWRRDRLARCLAVSVLPCFTLVSKMDFNSRGGLEETLPGCLGENIDIYAL